MKSKKKVLQIQLPAKELDVLDGMAEKVFLNRASFARNVLLKTIQTMPEYKKVKEELGII